MPGLLCILFLAFFPAKAICSLKTSCESSDSECGATWSPVDNLEAALVGYELPTGNPFASNFIEDPGLRKQIFQLVQPTVDDNDSPNGYKLEPGISIREYHMCDDQFKTKIATSIAGYKKIAISSSLTGSGYEVGIEAEEGDYEGALPTLNAIAWENSDDVKMIGDFFATSKGALAISEAQCITHKMDISQFLTPSFHPSFVEVLTILAAQDTEMKQERAFKRFVRDYGTHYISSAFLGAKMSALTHFSAFERLKLGKQNVLSCSAQQAWSLFKLKNPDSEKNSSQCWSDGDVNQVNNKVVRSRLVNFGSKPKTEEFSSWSEEDNISPIPIKFELTPIVNLMTIPSLDERYNVSSAAILKWFLPLYFKYCKVMKLECFPRKGCGLDDTCGLEETCVRERLHPQGFRCLVLSWADVPNWPQMTSKVEEDTTDDPTSRSDNAGLDAQPANVTWFRSMDRDNTGALSMTELLAHHGTNNWFNQRFRTAIDRLISEADRNNDRVIDMNEYLRLHEKHPWYSEQLAFLLVNTDNNGYLTKEELLEASKVSDDITALNFSQKQLENLVDGLIGIGDKNGDKRLSFDEYVHMSNDVFVDNFAPMNLKRVLRI